MTDIISLADVSLEPRLLEGKRILVTGATDGIGRALSLACAKHGAHTLLLGRNQVKLDDVGEAIAEEKGILPTLLKLDLEKTGWDGYSELAEELEERFESIDGLVHMAGILGDRSPIEHYSALTFARVMHINLTAPFMLTRAMLPLLKASSDASIIFSSSTVGREGRAFWGAYAVSKFGTEGLSGVLAQELENSNVRCNSLNPGATRTKMRLQAYPAEDRSKLASAESVAEKYVHLLSAKAKQYNGEQFNAQ